eukprot:jgi/Ulvmu1/434/UM001_0441.1
MFGGQSSGSLFGAAPAASGSLFGAPSSGGLFGTPQSSASLLGGQPTSGGVFGASAPAGGLFGAPASAAPVLGAPGAAGAPASGLFGAAPSSGGLFGAPAASSGGLFGAAAASSAAGGLFGAPAASSGGLFGAPAASSAGLFGSPASSGGLFGAPTASGGLFAAAPASSGGLFGAPAASSGGLFGGAAASGGLFGAPTAGGLFGASSAQGGLFGAPASSAPAGQQVALPTGHDLAHSQSEQAAIKRSLQELQELCTPGSSNCKLTHLFLYVVEPAQKVRPPDVPQAQWEAALQRAGGAGNRSGLWPVPVCGMQQLKAHHDAQQAALQGNRTFLADLQGLVARMSQWDEAALRRRAQALMDHHSHLALRLLKVVKMVDALAVRIAGSAECRSMDVQLEALGQQMAQVEAQLAPNKVQGLKYQVDSVVAAVEAMDPSQKTSISSTGVDPATMQKAGHLLAEHNRGIQALLKHLERVERDVTLVHTALNRETVSFVVPTSYPRKA